MIPDYARCYTYLYIQIFMPFRATLVGQVALIGDNLGLHFSNKVIKATLVHNIKFITLPGSSTHVCQPLDVAVFKRMTGKWKK